MSNSFNAIAVLGLLVLGLGGIGGLAELFSTASAALGTTNGYMAVGAWLAAGGPGRGNGPG